MAKITRKGNPIETIGNLPTVGSVASPFTLTRSDLSDVTLNDFKGKKLVLNIFPSLDTSVCAMSVRKFNEEAANMANTVVLCISADLPFAHKRFCETENIKNTVNLSDFRDKTFGKEYGLTIITGSLAGLLSRCVIVLDEQGKVLYTEQVPEIAQEPNYAAALKALV